MNGIRVIEGFLPFMAAEPVPTPLASLPYEVPWWLYVGGVVAAGAAGYFTRMAFLPWRLRQTGGSVPRSTVDLILQNKDEELARKDQEIDRLHTLLQLADAARDELEKSVSSMADSLDAFMASIGKRPQQRSTQQHDRESSTSDQRRRQ